MRKYSKLIVLAIIIVMTFSVYYGKQGSISKSFAQFNIKTIEGDEALLDNVMIKGDFFHSYINGESFRIKNQQTEYLRDQPFFNRIEDYYLSEKVSQLRKDYRNFMRMKDPSEDSYIENDDTIIYATVPYTRWGIIKDYVQLEIFNKETKETETDQIDMPDLLDWAGIEKMYRKDNVLYLIVNSTKYDYESEIEQERLDIISYDLSNKTIINSSEFVNEGPDYVTNFTNMFVDDAANPTELIVTGTEMDYEEIEAAEEMNEDELTFEEEENLRELVSIKGINKIDLETGESTEIKVKNSIENSTPVAYNGKEIIFVELKGKDLLYKAYDIEKEEMKDFLTVETTANFISIWDFETSVVKDQQLYSLINHGNEGTATLIVIDIKTGELIYKGIIENNLDEKFNKADAEVYLHTLELVE